MPKVMLSLVHSALCNLISVWDTVLSRWVHMKQSFQKETYTREDGRKEKTGEKKKTLSRQESYVCIHVIKVHNDQLKKNAGMSL